MGRKKDPIWDHVEKLNDKEFKCKKCGEKFAGGASRIKAHLLGIEGKGIRTCHGIPKDVHLATSSTFGDSNKAPYSTVNSCSPQHSVILNMPNDSLRGKGVLIDADVPEYVGRSTFSTINDPNQSIIINDNSSFLEELVEEYLGMSSVNFNQSIMENANSYDPRETYLVSNQNITRNIDTSNSSKGKSISGRKKERFWEYVETSSDGKVKCMFCGHKFIGGASRIKWHLSKTKKMGVTICSNVPKDVQEAACDVSSKRFKRNTDLSHVQENSVNISLSKGNAKLYPMPTSTNFISEPLQRYIEKIWSWLMNDEESLIGVCGMGGVGKTTLLKHIYNKLLAASYHVIWVSTVLRENSIFELQKIIAESFGLHISDKDDKMKITNTILHTLNKTNKCVIFLDDVWDDILLEDVGIPLINKGVRVIIATRLFDVCRTVGCKENILRIMPLSEYNWDDKFGLFFKVLGKDKSQFSHEVTDTSKSIIQKCYGLPLAIVKMARIMRGKEDIREWKYVMKNIRNSEMTKIVFPVLESSYIHLNDKTLQECLLQCAIYVKSEGGFNKMIKHELIVRFADEGLIDRKNSLETQLEEGHTILNKLINSNLLFEENEKRVRTHELVLDMALNIAEEKERYVVKICEDLFEVPAEQEWKEDLQKLWLLSQIKEIPSGTSPKCPTLSTLILTRGYSLKLIPDSFFINMPSLRVLNLSNCRGIQHLPASISNLVSLTALLLYNCSSLKSVPSLAELQKLERLDLSWTAITKLPPGSEKLINLRWLNLTRNGEALQVLVIPKLSNLQVLLLPVNIERGGLKAEDLEGLRKLESISANFIDRKEFNAYVRGIVNAQNGGPRYFFLRLMGKSGHYWSPDEADVYSCDKIIQLEYLGNTNNLLLPVDLNLLGISHCNEWRCLCDVLSFVDKNKSKSCKIKKCEISWCDKLEHVFCLYSSCSFCNSLQILERLELRWLSSLSILCERTHVTVTAPWGPFSSLGYLEVYECDRIKALLTPAVRGHLQNLETLTVSYCKGMEEIFSSDQKTNECTDTDFHNQLLEEPLSPRMGIRNYQEEKVADHATMIQLPKLKSVFLFDLPQLNRVYEGILACNALQKFEIWRCSNLKQVPQIQPIFQKFYIGECPYLKEVP